MAARKKREDGELAPLSRLEGVIMGVLWDLGESTAKEIRAVLLDTKPLAHTTVLTILSRLKEKGYIREVPSLGRSLTFKPIVPKEKMAKEGVGEVISRFFGGNPEGLVQHLIDEKKISKADLDDLRKKIRTSK
ncbi:MAG: BlaI/MecI/CopY family transcriptional regulator [Candidatus Omnitrophica bacterium]|nr:BlaI/MecI/CopY family transcriptional regulator [Candidatus Omnitrophota bacterium]MCA9432870.1 BlaI/MecI/CopY family transcriptional regulator [Candidatus Omnitrophota bacterium]MCA9435568.1 BlaI/MecI/CopY family transcriptional regulator [Candidatus Omnitrophota bacterium]MCA9441460.1 BlaI/MecI/CopY family transcriptional regulator [Candidatus Omnitrophota bacterium]MCB9782965.1 BlaI/MecI/CopY family transcriptional regulator [Candidatus Omnitrophota bacterium]